ARGRRLGSEGRDSRGRGNHAHLTMNQIGRQCRQPFVFLSGEAIFDRDVLTLDKACVFQALTEGGQELRSVTGSPGGEEPDYRHRRLLRARRKRPTCCRTAEPRNDLGASHVEHRASSPSPYPAGSGYQRGRGPQQSVYRTLSLPQSGRQILGPDLNRSELSVLLIYLRFFPRSVTIR